MFYWYRLVGSGPYFCLLSVRSCIETFTSLQYLSVTQDLKTFLTAFLLLLRTISLGIVHPIVNNLAFTAVIG